MVRLFRALLQSLLIAACALSLLSSSPDLAAQVQDNGDSRTIQSSHSANNQKKRRRARRTKSARRSNTSPPQTSTTTEQPATVSGVVKGVPNVDSGDGDQPLIPVPAPTPTPRPPRTRPISGGVLNGKAIALPRPAYPPVARAARAGGTVVVQVTVDEQGRVISARAISGHPLLQAAAVQAAYGARFPPTQLSGQPVKVTGTISYSFVP